MPKQYLYNRDDLSDMSDLQLRQLSDSDIRLIFHDDGATFLADTNSDKGTSLDYSFRFCDLYHCKIAQPSEDGNFLVLPSGAWSIGGHRIRSIYMRDAYKEHWEIIKYQGLVRKFPDVLLISGTCSAGKTVEGLYLLHQILNLSPEGPPVIYSRSNGFLLHYRGLYFVGSSYQEFVDSLAYRIIECTDGLIWHICDSGAPRLRSEWRSYGLQIIITSAAQEEEDTWTYRKFSHHLLYLPMPTCWEMKSIRTAVFGDRTTYSSFISEERMMELINKYGCNPDIVLNFCDLKELDKRIDWVVSESEKSLRNIFSWRTTESVNNGIILHLQPYMRSPRSNSDDNGSSNGVCDPEKVRANYLLRKYSSFNFKWASTTIRSRIFQDFLRSDKYMMKTIIRDYQRLPSGAWAGILMEPFLHKLFTKTGVIGLLQKLGTERKPGKIKLGPWRNNIYRELSEIDLSPDVCNFPHLDIETEIFAIMPSQGLIFGIARNDDRGINRNEIEDLFKAGLFTEFSRKRPDKIIQMIWVVETGVFRHFHKQEFWDKGEYGSESPNESHCTGLQQMAFEVDLLKMCELHSALRKGNAVNMTAKRRWKMIREGIESWASDVQFEIEWGFYRFRGLIGL